MDDVMRIAENVYLDGVLDLIRVPFLVTHGVQHSSFDNSADAGACIADRVAETPRGRTAL